jgi:alkaline phosphatase
MRLSALSVEEAERVILTAVENGIDFFDHADIYGAGKSEELFGQVLRRNPGLREKIVVQDKCGICKGYYDMSEEHILEAVDGALKRLGLEQIDTLLLHRPDALMEPEEVASAFAKLEKAGKVKGRRVILLSDSLSRREMRFATDRGEDEPTIVDYTEAAIKYLERESKGDGFFLMVEAGHVDYASHDNDAVTVFEEINDLSRSVSLALEFYERHPDETLIVVTADHETGGMSIGYSSYKVNMERLAHQRTSEEALTHKMQHMRKSGKTEWEDMKALLSEYLGLWDKVKLREKDERNLRKTFERNFLKDGEKVVGLYTSNEKMAAEAVRILNKRAYVNWVGLSHTAMQVPLYVKGAGELLFLDCYDNTDVPKRMATAMGCELK